MAWNRTCALLLACGALGAWCSCGDDHHRSSSSSGGGGGSVTGSVHPCLAQARDLVARGQTSPPATLLGTPPMRNLTKCIFYLHAPKTGSMVSGLPS